MRRFLSNNLTELVLAFLIGATLVILMGSCVTPGDLREVAGSLDQVAFRQEQLANGQITQEQFQQSLKDEIGNIQSVADEAMQRSSNILKGVGGAFADNPFGSILTLLLGAGGAIGGSVAATNKVRDARRVARGEPVTLAPKKRG